VRGAFAETQLFIGKGAGSYPTGSAVLSDISALSYGYAYEYKKHQQDTDLVFSNDLSVEAYVSFDQDDQVTISDFVEFKSGYATRGKQYMVGRISLQKLLALSKQDGIGIILAPKAIIHQSDTIKQLAVA
jgi:homoserine dehydrogenase